MGSYRAASNVRTAVVKTKRDLRKKGKANFKIIITHKNMTETYTDTHTHAHPHLRRHINCTLTEFVASCCRCVERRVFGYWERSLPREIGESKRHTEKFVCYSAQGRDSDSDIDLLQGMRNTDDTCTLMNTLCSAGMEHCMPQSASLSAVAKVSVYAPPERAEPRGCHTVLPDMAADLQPEWISCLPSSWSYGVTRDGRVFFINEEAKSTTWLHPVSGEAVITGHRKTPACEKGIWPIHMLAVRLGCYHQVTQCEHREADCADVDCPLTR
ncbi:Pleckstrin -like proteiny domain-containing family A member 5 [Collichthys lucidus]|uniref:Pleckstrin-like proteiny domain-containing family A member 5 n=1 Tax=Collichthys lucidus TaxID=240159 RepID=A0A4U5UG40_COLLU|nr:Pleckstrin -like proteiny domain-containing family A member 5 [Collichthys lucidus]